MTNIGTRGHVRLKELRAIKTLSDGSTMDLGVLAGGHWWQRCATWWRIQVLKRRMAAIAAAQRKEGSR